MRPPAATKAPRQARSRRTQDRFVDALRRLLETREPESITVQAIADCAHASVGAFYKRFDSKADLLPLLLTRLQRESGAQLAHALADSRWRGVGLAARVDFLIDGLVRSITERRQLTRACVASRFAARALLSSEEIVAAQRSMRFMQRWLLARRSEIAHEDPALAVRAGLYLCLQSLQTAILFESFPDELPPERLAAEGKRMLLAYLTSPGTS